MLVFVGQGHKVGRVHHEVWIARIDRGQRLSDRREFAAVIPEQGFVGSRGQVRVAALRLSRRFGQLFAGRCRLSGIEQQGGQLDPEIGARGIKRQGRFVGRPGQGRPYSELLDDDVAMASGMISRAGGASATQGELPST